ncbi:short-chain dehydrogenase/reductase SDR [Thermobaculum terrenum ATCC BAA-798]|uniref:Short-chain dehydrogenase/reductase SDR n=1 Tax=Thermobaculum terrenum (strain ATCC BAA-798 / CCMEE 7001 / YNP1) TaxID=525904 RepID=D1CHE9_THET1|nr:SDR family oxidoreductase [Thermobaculum terrenum]ACZ43170.1 short-chain dehydrogenase/reductase SDR [Thermobaculum terrenum ATCC BAA-798]
MGNKLQGKVAIVTGGTSGIGAGIARLFLSEGACVVVSGRDRERGARAVERLAQEDGHAGRVVFHRADLANPADCTALVERTVEAFGGVDVLVNNAGDFTRGTVEDTTLELWERHMAVNLRAPFLLMQACIPHMRARGGGSIINIGSVNAYIGAPNLFSYSVSKGGLMTMTKNAAQQLSKYRIRVNQLNVGWTLTEGEDRVQREVTGDPHWLEHAIATRPFGRLLLPKDIAKAALFFACDDSQLITGSVLVVEQQPVD